MHVYFWDFPALLCSSVVLCTVSRTSGCRVHFWRSHDYFAKLLLLVIFFVIRFIILRCFLPVLVGKPYYACTCLCTALLLLLLPSAMLFWWSVWWILGPVRVRASRVCVVFFFSLILIPTIVFIITSILRVVPCWLCGGCREWTRALFGYNCHKSIF